MISQLRRVDLAHQLLAVYAKIEQIHTSDVRVTTKSYCVTNLMFKVNQPYE